MATAGGCEAAPVGRTRLVKTPSGNPLPRRRGQVKERIVRDIADALATAAVLACGDRTVVGAGKKGEGGRAPAATASPSPGAKKK
ncbi:hypothetical protein BDA96_03G373600 [Sorghum bicolor]|jgi:hypothetical protein|uniref:Uncharacterized protein n=1 Tax=Sorghum bicolor TaxID=4558 RepID=A0A921RJ33_SORBI|nr:hypothetical protein BDA96_03G373600 [Sorghum bicolor]